MVEDLKDVLATIKLVIDFLELLIELHETELGNSMPPWFWTNYQ